ncbi:MAG: outer membrane lipoprotein carrier protein LolA [candidate division Zixibacteria bacterium]|nr:outer membrane lipoprotein carrier protein LolA [candidate division Zixibacteria bacterium]
MQEMKKSYKNRQFISLDFIQLIHSDIFETVDTLKGTVKAGWEGRFRLEMPHQQLVSNGILFWSYSVENEQVIVDSVAGLAGWNPLTLLYDPEGVYTCLKQTDAGKSIDYEMTAIDSNTAPASFILTAKKDNYVPVKLTYTDDNESRIDVFISDFSRPDSLSESLFEFIPPKGVEVIEMP